MSSPPLVVALAELTQMLGVTKNRAMQVSKKSDFPGPGRRVERRQGLFL